MLIDNNKKPIQGKTRAYQPEDTKVAGYYPDMPYPGMELARAYVPIQRFGRVYPPAQALETGTLFPELYRPYPY